jgi:hypothetical protein
MAKLTKQRLRVGTKHLTASRNGKGNCQHIVEQICPRVDNIMYNGFADPDQRSNLVFGPARMDVEIVYKPFCLVMQLPLPIAGGSLGICCRWRIVVGFGNAGLLARYPLFYRNFTISYMILAKTIGGIARSRRFVGKVDHFYECLITLHGCNECNVFHMLPAVPRQLIRSV